MGHLPIPERDEELAHEVIGAAIEVHRVLGPGFLESVYEQALVFELPVRNVPVERQRPIAVRYKEIEIPGQRLDLLVDARVIVELKAVDDFAPIHLAKTMSYMRTMDLRLGLMINFNVPLLKDGIRRVVL